MKTTLTNLVNSSKVFNTFINLKYRWVDEKGYENFNYYAKVMIHVIEKETNKDVKLIKGTKRPFDVIFEIEGVEV